jgi:hypothetical protein
MRWMKKHLEDDDDDQRRREIARRFVQQLADDADERTETHPRPAPPSASGGEPSKRRTGDGEHDWLQETGRDQSSSPWAGIMPEIAGGGKTCRSNHPWHGRAPPSWIRGGPLQRMSAATNRD